MSHGKIRDITSDKTVTYARIVVDYRPQKADPNHVSELSPPIPPMFNHHWPSTHRYPTRVSNGPQHLINCALKEHTLNMCMGPEMVESAIRPLWLLQNSATHRPTTHCMYNVMDEETSEIQN